MDKDNPMYSLRQSVTYARRNEFPLKRDLTTFLSKLFHDCNMFITIYSITELNFLTEFHKLTFYTLENDV